MFTIFAKKEKVENQLMRQMKSLAEIRTALMNDEIAKEICDENDIGHWFLKAVPISFDKMDVSAKTVDGDIVLCDKLLDRPLQMRMRYIIHELVHAIQHIKNFKKDNTDRDSDYLDRPHEMKAFQRQIEYDAETRGEDKAEDYAESLMSYHDVPEAKKDDKKKELMSEVG